jgi:DNA helicase-2/ATP-dependent DNA helicase PcrA
VDVEANAVVKIDFGSNGTKRIALKYTAVTKL